MDNRAIIQSSLDYIEENLCSEISAAELADMAGFSLFHSYRLFQQATGLSVMQYIQRRRLLHGVYAMKQGITKTDAALRYGFDTYAGFYKAFCREFGATPSAYLKSSRAKRPYRIDIIREEHLTITHKKAAQILKNWNLSDAKLTESERRAIPYIILANQFVCVAWFSEQDRFAELYETNKRMTAWLIEKFEELKII